jgi:hypothetical protein
MLPTKYAVNVGCYPKPQYRTVDEIVIVDAHRLIIRRPSASTGLPLSDKRSVVSSNPAPTASIATGRATKAA